MSASRSTNFEKLCEKIFAVDPGIRFAGVINKMGRLVAGGMRQGIKPLESSKDAAKLYLEYALRNAMRQDFDPEFGRVLYAFSEREKIKFATFPAKDHLVLVSIEKGRPHDKVINGILKLVQAAG